VVRFLPIFEAIAPDDFAQLVGSSAVEGEISFMGHLEYHPAVYKFMDACYENGMVLSFDWGAWSDEARRYMKDPQLVMSASLDTCLKLITTHLRAERFCDGHLEEVLRSGHITVILRRLQQLRSETPF
jgi:O-acetyl-ADP-ribose deacetylase